MAQEIERKFLVRGDQWRLNAAGTVYRQGYILTDPQRVVRVRIAGESACLTLKGESQGWTRPEFEYPIPMADAEEILRSLCQGPLIEKTRYRVAHGDLVWEVDEFAGDNAGLIVAEVELPEENYALDLPDWVGLEVSHDSRYFNASLVEHPYRQWQS